MIDPELLRDSYRLSEGETRMLRRMLEADGSFVPSRELYKAIRASDDMELDSFNPHVRVVACNLRRKLLLSQIRIQSRKGRGYRVAA